MYTFMNMSSMKVWLKVIEVLLLNVYINIQVTIYINIYTNIYIAINTNEYLYKGDTVECKRECIHLPQHLTLPCRVPSRTMYR